MAAPSPWLPSSLLATWFGAGLLGLPGHAVNVKVTSTDGLGAIGRGEGIAAQAVVLLEEAGAS